MKRNENKKSLKKKILVVSGLALLLGLVGYTGANTYAKYVTSADNQSQTATVAKWGYVVTANSSKLFTNEYEATKVPANDNVSKVDGDGNVTIKASADSNLVAPSATGEFSLLIKGTSEVRTQIIVTSALTDIFLDKDGDGAGTAEYNPLKWTVTENTAFVHPSATLPAGEITTQELDTFLESLNATYAPNTPVNVDLTFTWSWAFHTSEENDGYDTILGNLANGAVAGYSTGTYNLNFGLALTAKVEQVAE